MTLVTLVFYRPLKISTEELITGQFRTSEDIRVLPDTIHTKFYNKPDLSQFLDWNLYIEEVPSVVITNSKHKVLKNGRLVKELWIVCDSVISVTSWSAFITPPSYTNIKSYRLSDTIKAISGSSVIVNFKGLLTEYLEPIVS